ncbi:MAG: hypothetical protein ACE5GH_03180 [Fidelibacterota bacterium]
MFIKSIVFAIQIILAAVLVVPLFLSKNAPVPRERIGIYSIVSVVSATLIVISRDLHSGLVAASLFVAIGIISFGQFQKEDNWMDALQVVAPFWLVAGIGMCVGAGWLLRAVILTAVSYYIVNYLPILLGRDKGTGESEVGK